MTEKPVQDARKKEHSVTDDPRFASVIEAFAGDADITAGKMMASPGLKVRGKIFAMLVRGALVVKLPKTRVAELVSAGKGEPFEPSAGRVMKEWIALDVPPNTWLGFAREAHAFVKGL